MVLDEPEVEQEIFGRAGLNGGDKKRRSGLVAMPQLKDLPFNSRWGWSRSELAALCV